MLFNSYEFILIFLPATLLLYFLTAKKSIYFAGGFLGIASLFFYGWWSIWALPLLLGSIVGNYFFAQQILRAKKKQKKAKWILTLAVSANLILLAFFKYTNFFIENANLLFKLINESQLDSLKIILPIGISFFTFTQIAFLVDCWRGKVKEKNFIHYLLFVTYFPHLIAGPVLHHAQMMPQFARPENYRINYDKIAIGITLFILGLAKKLLIADVVAEYANIFFSQVPEALTPVFSVAWSGVLAYTVQIYFDFSGYTDMALGVSLLFGIRLPINFNSPYRATSIIEFWHRWHISLSNFLRDYLYIPLGGNKFGSLRRYLNLFTTMLLGGLWHGANWTFVLWGAAHGLFLTVNHLFRNFFPSHENNSVFKKLSCWALTFVCVCFSWVLFRAKDLHQALAVYRGLLGLNGFSGNIWTGISMASSRQGFMNIICLGLIICLLAKPSNILFDINLSPLRRILNAQNQTAMAISIFILTVLFWASVLRFGSHSPFLYFQF